MRVGFQNVFVSYVENAFTIVPLTPEAINQRALGAKYSSISTDNKQ